MNNENPAGLIAALQNPDLYDHPVRGFTVVETHISWVILTGDYAYKVKKPVDFGFLDFTTLERRRHYCEEELRLNRRLAPELYLDVVAIGGSPESPTLNGRTPIHGEAIEYAVKMAQFDQQQLADRLLARGELHPEHLDQAARIVADFHALIPAADAGSPFGAPDKVHFPVRQNFDQIHPLLDDEQDLARLEQLRQRAEAAFEALHDTLAARKAGGFVRECHGDIHLGNMAVLDGQVTLFDGIEFNEGFRWTDVMADVAFLVMDLEDRKRPDLARRFLNGYLEHSGDYAGLAVLPYYQAYRAMVRAKVACFRRGQPGLDEDEVAAITAQFRSYMGLAEAYAERARPFLMITHGVSGSGKSHHSRELVESLGAVRLRSDVERKRLFGLAPDADSGSAVAEGIYTAEAGRRTYGRLAELAREALADGYPVIVDATFLEREQRTPFRTLAAELQVPFLILECEADEATLRERVAARRAAGGDPSEAGLEVLERQLGQREALSDEERAAAVAPAEAAARLAATGQQ